MKPGTTRTYTTPLKGPGTYAVQVVGESHYLRGLTTICGERTYSGCAIKAKARLVSEDGNPHDANAIRVEIDGLTVGYLSREDARILRRALQKKGFDALNAEVAAFIDGGWDRGDGDEGCFSVCLDISRGKKDAEANVGCEPFSFSIPLPLDRLEEPPPVGERLNFYVPPDTPGRVVVFTTSGLGQWIGRVPEEFASPIIRQKEAGLPIEASISQITDGTFRITCRLVSEKEYQERRAAEMAKWVESFTRGIDKPLRPRKPIQTTLQTDGVALRIGDKLQIVHIPAAGDYQLDVQKPAVVFETNDGQTIRKQSPPDFKKRMTRMALAFDEFDCIVTGMADRESEYVIQVWPRK